VADHEPGLIMSRAADTVGAEDGSRRRPPVAGSSERPETALWSARRDGPVLRIEGALDVITADDVTERLVAEVLTGIDRVDLSGVEFCGAAGVRALLAGREAAHARGIVLRLGCPPPVVRVLELCGVADLDGWQVITVGVPGDTEPEEGPNHDI
jgi:anti-anti-sigma factor